MKHDEYQLTLSEDDRPLRGGRAIAQAIGKNKRTVQDWLKRGIIPADVVAGQYETTLRRACASITVVDRTSDDLHVFGGTQPIS